MVNSESQQKSHQLIQNADTETIRQFRQSITSGSNWYLALLEAIGLWQTTEETYDERTYHYLIAGEAFDWLLLAERMCEAATDLIPEEERTALLFHDRMPIKFTAEEFQKIIGKKKYHQYLNYFYGITTENALIRAVQEEVRKERQTLGPNNEQNYENETYQRIYGTKKETLLRQFRKEQSHPQLKSISITELKEFTYWRFKYRLDHSEKARVASDTKKALAFLKKSGVS